MIFSTILKPDTPVQPLLSYLGRRFGYHDLKEWQQRIDEKRVRLNGSFPNFDAVVRPGDTIDYMPGEWKEPEADLNYSIVFEDDWYIGINKPGNLLVHASGKAIRSNLIYQLRWINPKTSGYGMNLKLGNRVDKETSGVVLVAKNNQGLTSFHRLQEERKVSKEYLGICAGPLPEKKMTVNLPVGPHLSSSIRCKFGHNPGGKESVTEFEVMEERGPFAFLGIRPATGRTNQIRVHLEAIGHPLVGDKIYNGGDEIFLEWLRTGMTTELLDRLKLKRQALHAFALSFVHPVTGRNLRIEAPLPEDMRLFWENLKKESG